MKTVKVFGKSVPILTIFVIALFAEVGEQGEEDFWTRPEYRNLKTVISVIIIVSVLALILAFGPRGYAKKEVRRE